MKMIAISKAPYITFHKVARECVSTASELKTLAKAYDKPLRAQKMMYDGDDLAEVSVCLGGKDIAVDLKRTGVAFDLRFQTMDTSEPVGVDSGLFNRVR